MDESWGVIGNCKRICNEIRVEALVIKETDYNAVATSQNLSPEEAEILKFDQERSIADTMALKCFYMRNLYGGKDVNIDDWNNLCNKNSWNVLARLNLENISYVYPNFGGMAMMKRVQWKG